MDITDMDMDLIITNKSELEEGVEYYVIFSDKEMVDNNGIYTLVDISNVNIFDRFGSLMNVGDNNVKFSLYHIVLSMCCKFSILTNGWWGECLLFKIPANEYILK
jgi:hypothetical protein